MAHHHAKIWWHFLSLYLFIVTQCESSLDVHKAGTLGGKQAHIPFQAHSLHIGLLFHVFRPIKWNWIIIAAYMKLSHGNLVTEKHSFRLVRLWEVDPCCHQPIKASNFQATTFWLSVTSRRLEGGGTCDHCQPVKSQLTYAKPANPAKLGGPLLQMFRGNLGNTVAHDDEKEKKDEWGEKRKFSMTGADHILVQTEMFKANDKNCLL